MHCTILIPGWMKSLELYGNKSGFHMCVGKLDEEGLSADCVVGLSMGGLIALTDIEHIKGKIILVNPPIPRRNIFVWFARWVRYVRREGLFLEKQKFIKNPIQFTFEIFNYIQLLNKDFSNIFNSPAKREKLIVVRGKNDNFFCDNAAIDFLRSRNIKIIEVEGGHNWNNEIEKIIYDLMERDSAKGV